MDASECRRRLEEDTPALEAWGDLVISKINEVIKSEFGEHCFEDWVKIPPTHRVKKTNSFIAKAFVLNKGWFSCYEDIKDKVGARYVLGLSDQIKIVCELVNKIDIWNAIPSREFDEWKGTDPRLFDYQSAHYHLESLEDIVVGNIKIPSGTVCELQIRTLLQHAYAELSHDTLYKSNITSQPEIHRLFAKSMALMETTDDMLAKAKEHSRSAIKHVTDWRESIYHYTRSERDNMTFNYEEREDDFIIDSLSPLLKDITYEEVNKFASDKGNAFLTDRIIDAQATHHVFNTSAIYMIYFLAWRKPRTLPKYSKLERNMLAKIYSDLGIAPPWQTI
ncbi:RelA/SpoT domain-containing protein [Pseudomonas fragi]|uniref:RelA/SpoT domain-containing protein n=1 Tax=Pseudomonas fragi TaxID=296 RepID=UPI00147313C4|nr:RelA/SpoT domain-containing protein [Pseudomonas fragi]NNB54200.1 RelA/SpoT domain-containing protein [Pseudomonas fragi]